MVHGVEDWSDMSATKPKENKKPTLKNGRESKGAGSRRIFSPVFKLQVLDSYRQDADCQGNQRATARKYGIHRRQIQKWLQMETNLRLSVQKCNATALNLSSARQPDAANDGNAVLPVGEVKKEPLTSNNRSNNPLLDDECARNVDDDGCCNNASDSEEYVNVDEITDSEEDDDETSSCSSYEKNDKALDFTSATLSKRRFYTTDFKLHVLNAFKSDVACKGNQRATARKFGIHRRQVQKWLNQECAMKAEPTVGRHSNTCLDLSSQQKRKQRLDEVCDEASDRKRPKVLREDVGQESALCLVKSKLESAEANNNNTYHHHIAYPSALEHSYSSATTLNYVGPAEYPFCVYQPWHCCYQQISSVRNTFDAMVPKYSYAFNLKCEASYVDKPVQYGFGDSVPSKWLKENPVFLHGPPSIQVLGGSYR